MKKLTFLTALLLAINTFAQVPAYVPTNGLVGWWPFNGNANDESGNGNHGIVNGATLTTDRNGVANQAFSFDGIDDFIYFTLSQENEFSVSIWVKTMSNSPQSMIWQHKDNCTRGGGYMLINDNGQLRYFVQNCGQCSASTCNNEVNLTNISGINLTEWYHFVVVKDSVGNLKIYLNGTEVINNTNTINNLNYGNQPFSIGKWHDGVDLIFSNSINDDLGFWNRAITECEIKNLYNAGVPNSSQTQTALDSYTWPVNNQTYTQSGTYSDTLVNAAGCDSIVTLNLTLNFTGINELNAINVTISPNPTSGDFTLHGLELYKNITALQLTDVNGKLVKELDPTANKFSLGTVKPGVYFLTVTNGNNQEVIKLIKE